MIIGIGTDIVDIKRIEQSLCKYKTNFENRIFTQAEQEQAQTVKDIAAFYAKRFAAKEAFSKAMGTGLKGLGAGISRDVIFTDIEIRSNKLSCPELIITGETWKKLQKRIPQNMEAKLHISLSSESIYALAFVTISANLLVKV